MLRAIARGAVKGFTLGDVRIRRFKSWGRFVEPLSVDLK
jgi:hypothetical protein